MGNTVNVKDEFRRHPWSFVPGGTSVTIKKADGMEMVYDKVKFVERYLRKAFLSSDVLYAIVGDKRIERKDLL